MLTAPPQVWFPVEVTVKAQDESLNRLLAAADIPPGCSPRLAWQQTSLSVVARFEARGISDQTVDVTAIAQLQSGNTAAVRSLPPSQLWLPGSTGILFRASL